MSASRKAKVVIAGHINVGKSSILYRFDHDDLPTVSSTVGVSFARRSFTRDDETLSLDIWDTARQERFYSISSIYFRNATHCIFVFDLTDYHSFKMVDKWIRSCNDANPQTNLPTYFLVGNKVDQKRVIDRTEINEYCKKHDIYYYIETSAYTGDGIKLLQQKIVDHAFTHDINKIVRNDVVDITSNHDVMALCPSCDYHTYI